MNTKTFKNSSSSCSSSQKSAAEERLKEQILGFGLKASLPLVDFILSLKKCYSNP